MAEDRLRATRSINASPDALFARLTDPATHASIDGTGWVCDNIDTRPLTASGQVFRMEMYHPNHPDGRLRPRSSAPASGSRRSDPSI